MLNARLFGKPEFYCEARPSGCQLPQKAEELFCYLLSHSSRSYSRDLLCDLLWQEQPSKQSKNYLRKAFWQLQTAIDSLLEHSPNEILDVDEEWVRIRPQPGLWVDVQEFEDCFQMVRDQRGSRITEEQNCKLQAACGLYRGDFLENWYQDWCIVEREHYKEIYLAMIDKLMGYAEVHHQYDSGIEYGHRILSFDRAHERTHYRLMRLKYLGGDRTGALRQFEACRQALNDELRVEPGEGMLYLLRLIANNQPLNSPTTPRPNPATLPVDSARQTQRTAQQIINRITDLQAAQAALQIDMQREITLLKELLTASNSDIRKL